MKLSLSVITGNAEKYVNRFLDSFQPYFDEVVMVRAIGNQEPDKTLNIAKERGCITGEYINEIVEWPHVDDFAAARNLSLSLCTGDWIMWADMDDILENGQAIRLDVESMPDDSDTIGVPYDVRDDNVRIMRERIWRKGTATWKNPIHEELNLKKGSVACETNRWQVVHAPLGSRAKNDERNLRILESIDNPTGSQRFHLFQALRAVGRLEEAAKLAMAMITEKPEDLGKSEIYELLMSVGQMAENEMRGQLMLQAVALDPTRREGYGELAIFEMAHGRPENALAWLNAMESLKMPERPAWNMRRMFYTYQPPLLRGMALRMIGRPEEADAIESNAVIEAGAKISLLHATRGRADKASACRRKWLETAFNPEAIEHIFGLDLDDDDAIKLSCHRAVWTRGNGGPVEAWNQCAAVAHGEVFIQLSDDWEPFQGWDAAILSAIGDTSKPAVLAISDGHRKDDLLCMAILTKARYKQQGYMFHPEFFSMYSDNWFSECAFRDGVVIDARDRIIFEHMHPAFGKAEMDEIYQRSNSGINYVFGKGIYDRLQMGIKVSTDIPGWFDFRNVYDAVSCYLKHHFKFVEVGSWMGKSAVYLNDRLHDNGTVGHVVCVDTFQGDDDTGKIDVLPQFLENIKGRLIDYHQMTSTEAATIYQDGELDGCFIDAAHDYESAKADIIAWLPKVKKGGFFGGHDADSHGVKRALAECGFQYHTVGRCWIKSDFKP